MRPSTSVRRESHCGQVADSWSKWSGTGLASSWTGLYRRGTRGPPADPAQASACLRNGRLAISKYDSYTTILRSIADVRNRSATQLR